MDMDPQVDNHYLQCLFSRQRRYLCHQNKDFHIRLNRLSYHYHHYLYHHYRISLARLVEVGHRHCNQHLHHLLHHHHHYLLHHHNLSLRITRWIRNQDLRRLLHHHHHYLDHHHNLSPRHYAVEYHNQDSSPSIASSPSSSTPSPQSVSPITQWIPQSGSSPSIASSPSSSTPLAQSLSPSVGLFHGCEQSGSSGSQGDSEHTGSAGSQFSKRELTFDNS